MSDPIAWAPRPMSADRARREGEWLLARLADLRLDVRRFMDKATECSWPEVAVFLEQADEQVATAVAEMRGILDV